MDLPSPILITENAEAAWAGRGTSVDNFIADGAILAGQPVILSPSAGVNAVAGADGAVSTTVVFAGVAINAAADGEEVAVITRGAATVAKQTGTAWVVGQMLGIGSGKNLVPYSPDLDGTNVAFHAMGPCLVAAASGDATGLVFVTALGA